MARDVENVHAKPAQPSWASIPNKSQLIIIWSIRAADFFQQAALQTYMYYQLKSFSPNANDSEISFQSGVLLGIFTAAQIFTGVYWGKLADTVGRKKVVLIGLLGQGISCVGVGFCGSFTAAVVWRCLGGAVNATVGGARTCLAEATEKKYHSRTFLLLPLAWNFSNIFGPLFGGILSDPAGRYPSVFGDNGLFGQTMFSALLNRYPYMVPNLFCALVMFFDAAVIWLGLKETLASRKHRRDTGREVGEAIRQRLRTIFHQFRYTPVSQHDNDDAGLAVSADDLSQATQMVEIQQHRHTRANSLSLKAADFSSKLESQPNPTGPDTLSRRSSFLRVLTRNVIMVLISVALMDFQMGGFQSLWTIFLSSSTSSSTDQKTQHLPFKFTGGLGFVPATVGLAMSILGFAGIIVQLTLYPRINARFGLLRSFRYCLFVFPLAYSLAPYLSLLHGQPAQLWTGIIAVAFLQIIARTFAVPGAVLLTNNAAPSPDVLGTIHGLGAAVSSAFRTIGPIAVGHWYAQGIEMKIVGYAWWLLALMSVLGIFPSFLVRDGK